MGNLLFFDSNAIIGQPVFDPESGRYTGHADRQSLLSSLDYYGVELALVSHWRALHGDPLAANEALVREIAGSNRLFPCFTILPENVEDSSGRALLSDSIKKNAVRAVRIPFGESLLCCTSWVLSELFDFCSARGLLVILPFPYLGVAVPERDDPYLAVLDALLGEFPRLRVVTLGRLRGFYPLMAHHENLLTSLAWDPYPDFVEDVTRRFGSHRILFGTPYCENAREISGMPMMMVAHADIPAQKKAGIAGGNLAQLLGLSLAEGNRAAKQSRFSALLQERGIDAPIVDVHTHVGYWIAERKPAFSAEDLIHGMRSLGPATLYINSTEAVTGGDHVQANQEIAQAARAHPEVLRGVQVYDPGFGGNAASLAASIASGGFRAVKIHPRIQRCAITDPRYIPVWQASESAGVPVLCHTGQGQAFSEPDQFAQIAPRYPRGRFILAHTGETFAGMDQCIRLLNSWENLFVDVSGWLFMKRGMLEYLVRRVDPARILYGSDYSWIDVRYALATVLFTKVDEQTKRMILHENAERVFAT